MITDGEKRRARILEYLETAGEPVSGAELAARLGVSRQVIVQDIALLRAEDREIAASYKGYVLRERLSAEKGCIRVFRVRHSTEDTLDELQTIVDYGGNVRDVFVEHALYGEIRAGLVIRNRLDAREFVEQMQHSADSPLKSLTGGSHFHTVSAESERNLDYIEAALREKGYLDEEKHGALQPSLPPADAWHLCPMGLSGRSTMLL